MYVYSIKYIPWNVHTILLCFDFLPVPFATHIHQVASPELGFSYDYIAMPFKPSLRLWANSAFTKHI